MGAVLISNKSRPPPRPSGLVSNCSEGRDASEILLSGISPRNFGARLDGYSLV